MSNGLLGKLSTTANSYVTAYTVPPNAQYSVVNINCVNMDPSNSAVIRIACTTNPSNPANIDHIEYDVELPLIGSILERTNFVLSSGESIAIWSNNSNVVVRVYGLEQSF